MLARKLALVVAAVAAAGAFQTAPASAQCIEVDGLGCVNTCSVLGPVYYKVTGRPLICTM